MPVPGSCPPGLSHTGLRGLGDLLGLRPRLILSVQEKQSLVKTNKKKKHQVSTPSILMRAADTRSMTSGRSHCQRLRINSTIKGQQFVNLFPTYLHRLRLAHWLWRRCFLFGFHQSHLPISFLLLLRHRCCLSDFTRAFFCNLDPICGWFSCFSFLFACFEFRPFCMFLS